MILEQGKWKDVNDIQTVKNGRLCDGTGRQMLYSYMMFTYIEDSLIY